MTDLARRMTLITLTMAVFALAFSQLVINTAPTKRNLPGSLVASCEPTGLNTCRLTF
ncbi:hypothetical protein [Peteryoungia ipomoeae]|uniref:hypothetical protein n=1 Tax=Peteryoungia ipomoeae TaxID=1210932 RepID=UPI0014562DFB|nr:hypothetical protein [Peteryoungia ipomoeae]